MSPATHMTGAPEHWQVIFVAGVFAFVVLCAVVGFAAFLIALRLGAVPAVPDETEDPDDAR